MNVPIVYTTPTKEKFVRLLIELLLCACREGFELHRIEVDQLGIDFLLDQSPNSSPRHTEVTVHGPYGPVLLYAQSQDNKK